MIEHREWDKWPVPIQYQLRSLVAATPNPGASWADGDDATAITALNDPEVQVDTFVMWKQVHDSKPQELVGWAMAARSVYCPRAIPEVSIFVRPEFRYQGFASALFGAMMLANPTVSVSIWNERSHVFYNRMASKYFLQVIMHNYWYGGRSEQCLVKHGGDTNDA